MSLHFKPKPILIAERCRFHRRYQKEGETLTEYIVDLKILASTCKFGQFLDALRDQFVCGMSGEAYRKRLLSEKDLTFKQACEIALGLELAYKDTKELTERADHSSAGVHSVASYSWGKQKGKPQRGSSHSSFTASSRSAQSSSAR